MQVKGKKQSVSEGGQPGPKEEQVGNEVGAKGDKKIGIGSGEDSRAAENGEAKAGDKTGRKMERIMERARRWIAKFKGRSNG